MARDDREFGMLQTPEDEAETAVWESQKETPRDSVKEP